MMLCVFCSEKQFDCDREFIIVFEVGQMLKLFVFCFVFLGFQNQKTVQPVVDDTLQSVDRQPGACLTVQKVIGLLYEKLVQLQELIGAEMCVIACSSQELVWWSCKATMETDVQGNEFHQQSAQQDTVSHDVTGAELQ